MILDNGCYAEFASAEQLLGRPCLLLDRDGVVVEETHYLSRVEDVRLIEGVDNFITRARAAGYVCGLVTNQSGIGRGYYGWEEFLAVQQEIGARLAGVGTRLDFVLACPFHRDAPIEAYRNEQHPWRKPAPGMLQAALAHFRSPPERSIMVGDRLSDLEAGAAAEVGRLVHVVTGHGAAERAGVVAWATGRPEVDLAASVVDVVLPKTWPGARG